MLLNGARPEGLLVPFGTPTGTVGWGDVPVLDQRRVRQPPTLARAAVTLTWLEAARMLVEVGVVYATSQVRVQEPEVAAHALRVQIDILQ